MSKEIKYSVIDDYYEFIHDELKDVVLDCGTKVPESYCVDDILVECAEDYYKFMNKWDGIKRVVVELENGERFSSRVSSHTEVHFELQH